MKLQNLQGKLSLEGKLYYQQGGVTDDNFIFSLIYCYISF